MTERASFAALHSSVVGYDAAAVAKAATIHIKSSSAVPSGAEIARVSVDEATLASLLAQRQRHFHRTPAPTTTTTLPLRPTTTTLPPRPTTTTAPLTTTTIPKPTTTTVPKPTTTTTPKPTTTTTPKPAPTTTAPAATTTTTVPKPTTTTTTTAPPATTSTTTTTTVPPASSSSTAAKAGAVLGVYAGAGAVSSLAIPNSLIGHKVNFAMEFLDGTSWATMTSPEWALSNWVGTGYQMIWGVPMLPNSGASLATGATGAYNQYFTTIATKLVAAGQGSSIIRLGWEFNGGWFPWAANGQAANFIAYWQQIVTTMRAVPGANFKFEWNPTRGDQGVGNLANYYPGDNYVDIVGLDVYDQEWASYPGPVAEWQHMLTQSYGLNWLVQFGIQHNKPISIPEWGMGWTQSGEVGGGDNAYYVQQMANWAATNNVSNVVVWQDGPNALPDASQFPDATAALGQYW